MTHANEPVHVFDWNHGNGNVERLPGLTKRELFAAMAMQGMLADPNRAGAASVYAKAAVEYADALIATLNKEQTP